MLGFKSFWVFLPFVLMILSTLLCVVYGIVNWNKGAVQDFEVKEEKDWAKEESKIEKSL